MLHVFYVHTAHPCHKQQPLPFEQQMHEEAMSVVCDFDPDQQDIIKSWTDLGDPVSNLARNKSCCHPPMP
jgi:hypothetical protein